MPAPAPTNLHLDTLPEVMSYLHGRGVRGYVTLNTLVFPSELDAIERTVVELTEAGVDAVLVQDLGLVRLIRAISPDLADPRFDADDAHQRRVHPRRRGAWHRARGAGPRAFDRRDPQDSRADQRRAGNVRARRTVRRLFRPVPHERIARRPQRESRPMCPGLPIAVRSGLRRPATSISASVKYLLSPQDLAAYELVPELIDAGVSCFKIEGRLKTPEYVANITRHYRRAIDAAAGRPAARLHRRRTSTEMELSFSRGFSPGWLGGCDHKMLVPGLSSAKRGVLLGRSESRSRPTRAGRARAVPWRPAMAIVFAGDREDGDEQGGRVYEVTSSAAATSSSPSATTQSTCRGSSRVSRFGRPTIRNSRHDCGSRSPASKPQRRVGLDLDVTAAVGEPLRITGQADNGATVPRRIAGTAGRGDQASAHRTTYFENNWAGSAAPSIELRNLHGRNRRRADGAAQRARQTAASR